MKTSRHTCHSVANSSSTSTSNVQRVNWIFKQVSFDAAPSNCMPPPLLVNSSGYDLYLWPFWPWNLFSSAWPCTCWIFVTSFIAIPPLSKKRYRITRNGCYWTTDGRATNDGQPDRWTTDIRNTSDACHCSSGCIMKTVTGYDVRQSYARSNAAGSHFSLILDIKQIWHDKKTETKTD